MDRLLPRVGPQYVGPVHHNIKKILSAPKMWNITKEGTKCASHPKESTKCVGYLKEGTTCVGHPTEDTKFVANILKMGKTCSAWRTILSIPSWPATAVWSRLCMPPTPVRVPSWGLVSPEGLVSVSHPLGREMQLVTTRPAGGGKPQRYHAVACLGSDPPWTASFPLLSWAMGIILYADEDSLEG